MKTRKEFEKVEKKFWILPLLLFVLSIIFQIFLPSCSYNWSIQLIISLQKWIRNSVFHCQDNIVDCKSLGYTYEIVAQLNTNLFYVLFTAILYNFVNVYKSLVLLLSIFLSNFYSSFLNYIFHEPRPFMVNSLISPFFMWSDWGSPNTQIVTTVAFYMTLYIVTFKAKNTRDNLKLKMAFSIIFTFIIIFFILMHLSSGCLSFDQLIFSILIGLVVYFTMFSIFNIKVNDPSQFYYILTFKTFYYVMINIILGLFLFLLYIFSKKEEEDEYFIKNINEQSDNKPQSFLQKNYNTYFTLYNGTFSNTICALCNIIAIISLKCELYFDYKKNFDLWKRNNFETYSSEVGLEYSITSDYKNTKKTQWNHTGILKSLIRLLLIVVLMIIGYLPGFLIIHFTEKQTTLGFIFYVALPMYFLVFGMFHFFKIIFRKFKLANSIVKIK